MFHVKHPDKEGHRAMNDSITVPIPDDVLGNSPHTVRVVSNGVRAEEGGVTAAEQLTGYRKDLSLHGYTMTETEDHDADGNRTLTTEFSKDGTVLWTYRTTYYTRVACARCPHRWAQVYVVIEQGEFRTAPEPLCGDHWSREEIRAHRSQRGGDGIAFTLHRSDWLRIGQH